MRSPFDDSALESIEMMVITTATSARNAISLAFCMSTKYAMLRENNDNSDSDTFPLASPLLITAGQTAISLNGTKGVTVANNRFSLTADSEHQKPLVTKRSEGVESDID